MGHRYKINIKELTFNTIIGILPKERKKKQPIIINISFEYEFDGKRFIDYAQVVKRVKRTIKKGQFGLLEEALFEVKKDLMVTYTLHTLSLEFIKPSILKECQVSLSYIST